MWSQLRSAVITILSLITRARRSRTKIAQANIPTHAPPKNPHPKSDVTNPAGTAQPRHQRPDSDDPTPFEEDQPPHAAPETLTRHSTQSLPNEPNSTNVQQVIEPAKPLHAHTQSPPASPNAPRQTPSAQSQLEPDPDHTLLDDQYPPPFASAATRNSSNETKPQQPDLPAQNSGQPQNSDTITSPDNQSTLNDTPPSSSSSHSESAEGQLASNRARQTSNAAPESNESSTKPKGLNLSPPDTKTEDRKSAPKYDPPSIVPPTPPLPGNPAATSQSGERKRQDHNRAADIKLRILFERGGYCRATLLPSRPPNLPEQLSVTGPTGSIPLLALGDDWYQDVQLENLGHQLLNGILWTDQTNGREWVLSARDLFVFAASTTHRGFVSTSRLVLEQEHTIACTTSLIQDVEKNLRDAGCLEWTRLDSDDGAPAGWIVLRGVIPTRPVAWSDDAGILNVLRPLPDIQIQLDGGIRLRYGNWLSGYPPSIHVHGDLEHTNDVLIDGRQAQPSTTGGYAAPGWDADGDHQVWCEGTSASYSLVKCDINSQPWPAYAFRKSSPRSHIGICGPLVRSFDDDLPQAVPLSSNVVPVPRSNTVLVGRNPGEIFAASPRLDVFASPCVASPPFTPVWAIPAQPLRCFKPTSRVLLIGDPASSSRETSPAAGTAPTHAESKWCSMILDAARKGLPVHPQDPLVHQLWTEYKATARHLWKLRRSKS